MNRTIWKWTDAYKVEIFIGGNYLDALYICQEYCDKVGLCVTVDPTDFVYSGGSCVGVRIGLINYARFPSKRDIIWDKAEALAELLKEELDQGSYTVQDPIRSMFVSTRDEDQ